MKWVILGGKTVTLLFWLAVIVSLFDVFPEGVSSILGWAAVIILLVHLCEVAMFTKRFGHQLAEPKYEKLMVLVFGIFHVFPHMLSELKKGTGR